MDERELAAMARQHAATALKVLAEIADSTTAKKKDKEKARRELEVRLMQLRNIVADERADPDLRRDAKETLRKFTHS
jgi:hypothetical protein